MGDYDADRPDVWTWLQAWYVAQCDGDWEHGRGIEIGTLDNPGWQVAINLLGTSLQSKPFDRNEVHRSEDDWCVTWVAEETFKAACGPVNLAEALHSFRVWVSAEDGRAG